MAKQLPRKMRQAEGDKKEGDKNLTASLHPYITAFLHHGVPT